MCKSPAAKVGGADGAEAYPQYPCLLHHPMDSNTIEKKGTRGREDHGGKLTMVQCTTRPKEQEF